MGKEQFAQATQKFLEAGDGFDRARRASEVAAAAAAAAAAQAAAARAATLPTHAPVVVPTAVPPPTLAPTQVAQLPPVAPPVVAPSLPAPPSTGTLALSPEPTIRRVIADFGRAIETKDIDALQERTSRHLGRRGEAAAGVLQGDPVAEVALTVDSLQVDGAVARPCARRARTR